MAQYQAEAKRRKIMWAERVTRVGRARKKLYQHRHQTVFQAYGTLAKAEFGGQNECQGN